MLYSLALKMTLNAIMKMRERGGEKGNSILQDDKVLSNCKFL